MTCNFSMLPSSAKAPRFKFTRHRQVQSVARDVTAVCRALSGLVVRGASCVVNSMRYPSGRRAVVAKVSRFAHGREGGKAGPLAQQARALSPRRRPSLACSTLLHSRRTSSGPPPSCRLAAGIVTLSLPATHGSALISPIFPRASPALEPKGYQGRSPWLVGCARLLVEPAAQHIRIGHTLDRGQ
jgi:hypothetical protein